MVYLASARAHLAVCECLLSALDLARLDAVDCSLASAFVCFRKLTRYCQWPGALVDRSCFQQHLGAALHRTCGHYIYPSISVGGSDRSHRPLQRRVSELKRPPTPTRGCGSWRGLLRSSPSLWCLWPLTLQSEALVAV